MGLYITEDKKIIVEVVRPERRQVSRKGIYYFYLIPEHQDLIFDKLRQLNSKSTPQEVFDEISGILNPQQPGFDLQRNEMDICMVADYIGFLRGLWPDPQKQRVGYSSHGFWGLTIGIPQGNTNVYINLNEQRFIRNETERGRTEQNISDDLDDLHKKENSAQTKLDEDTIRRLRFLIADRIQEHPAHETADLVKVNTPYAQSEEKTVSQIIPYRNSHN